MLEREAAGEKVYTGAYMLRGAEYSKDSTDPRDKAHYTVFRILDPLYKNKVMPGAFETLESYHQRLMQNQGLGSFLAAQIIADLKFTPLLSGANDWLTFAAPGPGSARGLNRVLGRDKNSPWNLAEWRSELEDLRDKLNPLLDLVPMKHLCAQNLQNCLCEFDKYERVRLGEGKPRSRYNGKGE